MKDLLARVVASGGVIVCGARSQMRRAGPNLKTHVWEYPASHMYTCTHGDSKHPCLYVRASNIN
jgi:hypothetical protein